MTGCKFTYYSIEFEARIPDKKNEFQQQIVYLSEYIFN